MSVALRRMVLVVDDAPEIASRLRDLLLEAHDLDVAGIARDGLEGLQIFEETSPAAVVVDLQMPRLDGVSLIRAIRATDPRCAVIVLTGNQEPSIREACFAVGADEVLHKPWDLPRLLDVVRSSIEQRQRADVGNALTSPRNFTDYRELPVVPKLRS